MEDERRKVEIPASFFKVSDVGSFPITIILECRQQELVHGAQAYCDLLQDDEWEHIKLVQDRKREREK